MVSNGLDCRISDEGKVETAHDCYTINCRIVLPLDEGLATNSLTDENHSCSSSLK